MAKTIWFNEKTGYDCISNEDFERYERIVGFNNTGNADVSLNILHFASTNAEISNARYGFKNSVNTPRGSRDWLKMMQRMKVIIEKEIEYCKDRIADNIPYVTEKERSNCYIESER